MSTYTSDAVNPKTGVTQAALFVDDFYGVHQYAVAFRKDGADAVIEDGLEAGIYDVYGVENIEQEVKRSEGDNE